MTEGAINLLTLLICLAVIVTFVRNKLPGMDALLASAARFGVEFLLWVGYGVGLFFRWLGYAVILRREAPPLTGRFAARDYVESSGPATPADPVRSAAFTNTEESACTAPEPPRTERTPDPTPEPGVQIATLEGADLQVILDALERRGYLCLSPAEQGIARDLVYHTEKAARFNPVSERSKTAVIERATGLKRGGSKDYQRTSQVYDGIVGKPPPAVSNLQQEAKTA